MPATYEPIATTTLTGTATAITFSSIPSTYTDLRVVLVAITGTGFIFDIQFNNDTATNYSSTRINGDGATATSARETASGRIRGNGANSLTTQPNFTTIDVFSYAGSTNKTALVTSSADANGSGTTTSIVGLWRSTAAINRLDISGGTFGIGTTATLYGIKAA